MSDQKEPMQFDTWASLKPLAYAGFLLLLGTFWMVRSGNIVPLLAGIIFAVIALVRGVTRR